MKTYIVLLRGINVSGQKKIKMADLRALLEKLGFSDVATYIQSGNIVLTSNLETEETVAHTIHQGIANRYGFKVPVLVKSRSDFAKILDENPFTDPELLQNNYLYFVLLKQRPDQEQIDRLQSEDYPNERFTITENCVYLGCLKGYGKAKLDNNLLERKLKVSATTRNYKTMMKLLEMSTMNQ
ncbi:MAG: DUF1697 domain-containing protein [Bacteroidota bacterium]